MGAKAKTLSPNREHESSHALQANTPTSLNFGVGRGAGEDEAGVVPMSPQLASILRAHIERCGVAENGRLFHSERGNVVSAPTYSRVWAEARRLALTPDQFASPLAGRSYDLRPAAVSLWFNASVPLPRSQPPRGTPSTRF